MIGTGSSLTRVGQIRTRIARPATGAGPSTLFVSKGLDTRIAVQSTLLRDRSDPHRRLADGN
jgi:hypothetical protein